MDHEFQPKSSAEQAFAIAKAWLQDPEKLAAITAGVQAYIGMDPSRLQIELSQLVHLNTKKLLAMNSGDGVLYILWGTLSAKIERGENISNLKPDEISTLVTDAYRQSAASGV